MQLPTPQDKFAEFDARLSRIEGIVTQMDKRLSNLEQGQRDLSNRLTSMDNRQNSNFKWLVGLLITVLIANIGTAITIILILK